MTLSWLANRLYDAGTVILDATLPPVGVAPAVDIRARYKQRHIPGAVFFDIEEFSDPYTSLPHMLPTPEVFAHGMSALGVSDRMTIVVCEQEGVFSAPRAWWMLRVFGVRRVYLLDGDLRAWVEAGLPTESGTVVREHTAFHAKFDRDAVKTFAQIQQMIAEHAQILDARSAGRFNGALPEPRARISSGHIPGSINIPFSELINNRRLKPAEKLRELFKAKGVNLEQPITTTCGSGVTAAIISLSLEIVGAERVSLYDGAWSEYAQHPEAVITKE